VSKGLSYIPIPSGAGESFAGLFTIDLPPSQVSSGRTFEILVRRLSSMNFTPQRPPQAPRTTHSVGSPGVMEPAQPEGGKAQPAVQEAQVLSLFTPFSWRYNVGSFTVKIPVTTGDQILPSEENTFAIMS
jgi:hypothetical protein